MATDIGIGGLDGFEIRLATRRDLAAASRFATPVIRSLKFYNQECTKNNIKEVSAKALADDLAKDANSVILAVQRGGGIVGIATHFMGLGHVDWLDWILVSQDCRSRGIAAAMLKYAMDNAKGRGCHKVWCDSNPQNVPALRFFSRMGFRKVGVLRRHSFGQDQIIWERLIR